MSEKAHVEVLFSFVLHNIFTNSYKVCYIYINIIVNRGGK